MQQIQTYMILFLIIIIVGQLFNKSSIPITLILVITGMVLSIIPNFPEITLTPELVLHIFLPVLVYQISSFSSWIDMKKNFRPILLLSVGHVFFITVLVAGVVYALIPEFGWPLAFVLGAVISPPDDVAIVTIAEKIRLPGRVVTILEGEGLLNDATALILFKFALAATLTHQFMILPAVSHFFVLVIAETLYGIVIGCVIGELRLKLGNTTLHMMASLLTPFIAYIPSALMGGSGVLATVVTGFIIGHRYAIRFAPEFRVVSRSLWPTICFGIYCILFLLVGLDMRIILQNISSISIGSLAFFTSAIIFTVIIGRFIWVYLALIFLPRFLFPHIKKKDPYPPWQYPFIISWAGLRGGISLAAALAVPFLPNYIEGANAKDFLIFLVFSVITATFLIQGLTLPWIIKVIGIKKFGEQEQYEEHLAELYAKKEIASAILLWLKEFQAQNSDDSKFNQEIKLYIREYKMQKNQLIRKIRDHGEIIKHDESAENESDLFLAMHIIQIERVKLMQLWRSEKIPFTVRNKLLDKLDRRFKNLSG
jgi:CPA1 family monovalent cation:H+ antiporter